MLRIKCVIIERDMPIARVRDSIPLTNARKISWPFRSFASHASQIISVLIRLDLDPVSCSE